MHAWLALLLIACGDAPDPAPDAPPGAEVPASDDGLAGRWTSTRGTGEVWDLQDDGSVRWTAPDRCGDRVAAREGRWRMDGAQLVVHWTADHRETGAVERGGTCDRSAVRTIRARVDWSDPMEVAPCPGEAGDPACRRWNRQDWRRDAP